MDAELSHFKTLSIETYAQTLGYERDCKKSSRSVSVLRRASDNDKLLVRTDSDGHSVYISERDKSDRGSLVDFVMTRLGVNLGEARKELRTWANLPFHSAQTPIQPSLQRVLTHEPDRAKLKAVWGAATWNPDHPYLLLRGLDRGTLADPRFLDCYRQDSRGNAVFPHFDLSGLSGLEIRNKDIKLFGAGGRKGLWLSRNVKTASRIVVTESPIDALSHFALRVDATDTFWPLAYVAFGGGLGTRQKELLTILINRALERGAQVIVGGDNDPAGDQYAETLNQIAGRELDRDCPIDKDWNADLAYCNREQGGTSWN